MNSDANNKNTINPKHLLHSKWTATEPKNQEQHFIVTRTVLNKKGQINLQEILLRAKGDEAVAESGLW